MNTASRLLCVLSLAALAGACQPPKPIATTPNANQAVARSADLEVTMTLPKRTFQVGEPFSVAIAVQNLTTHPIRIQADSRDLVQARLFEKTLLGWERLKEYPRASTTLLTDWTLPAGQSRTFQLNLVVEPDWPAAAPVRLAGVVNGRGDVSPFVVIQVAPRSEPQRAAAQ